jgi:hypothetical protein
MCFKGIAESFENSKYVKNPNEGIVDCAPRVFSMMDGVLQTQHM